MMLVDTLQELACTKFLCSSVVKEDTLVTVSRMNVNDPTRPKPELIFPSNFPQICQILRAADPLWMFELVEKCLQSIRNEMQLWVAQNQCFPENTADLLAPIEISLNFRRNFVWKNLRLNARQTARHLALDETILLDYRLMVAVYFGWIGIANDICQKHPESHFQHLTIAPISECRRLALGFLNPEDIVFTSSNHLRLLNGHFLLQAAREKVVKKEPDCRSSEAENSPVERQPEIVELEDCNNEHITKVARLLSESQCNFAEILQRLMCEWVWDMEDAGDSKMTLLLKEFLKISNRNVQERIGPIMVSTLLSTFCNSAYRCEKLLTLSRDFLCGEQATENLLDNWSGGSTITPQFDKLNAVLLSISKHPVVIGLLLKRLKSSSLSSNTFQLSQDSLLILAQRNDLAVCRLVQMFARTGQQADSESAERADTCFSLENLCDLLSRRDFELFYALSYCNCWQTLALLRQIFNLSNKADVWSTLVESKDFSSLTAACKRGHFLVLYNLTRQMNKATWINFFSRKNFEAFYTVCKAGHKALVEWMGQMCNKFDEQGLFEEAHLFTVKVLEVEEKSLMRALENLNLEQQQQNQSDIQQEE